MKLAPLGGEDAREDLVVLEAQCLHARDEGFEGEGEGVAHGEDQGGGDDTEHAPGAPERRGPAPYQGAEGGVGEAERGEAGEGDGVGAEAKDGVEEFDACLLYTSRCV